MKREYISKVVTFAILPLTIIPIITMGTIKLIKIQNIKKNKRTKILSLDNISHPFSLDELENIETFSDCIISGNVHCKNNGDKHIEVNCIGKQFAGNKCNEKFFFCDNQLSICNFIFDNLSDLSKTKQIYKELIKVNGKPDKTKYNRKICCLQYNWYGNNGEITYYKFRNDMIVIVFEIEK